MPVYLYLLAPNSDTPRPAIFDEYTRRQFVAKAPERNPFGEDEEPNKFDDFDIFTKIRVLQQLSIWTLNNPNSIRERLAAPDSEQTLWVCSQRSRRPDNC